MAKPILGLPDSKTRKLLSLVSKAVSGRLARLFLIATMLTPPASVVASHSFDVRQQERHFDPPSPTRARLQNENCLVSYPSHS